MPAKNEFIEFLLEQMASLGPVHSKRMFGGHGIYLDGIMFALVADNTLYFKTDDRSRGDYEQRGLPPFQYQRKGKTISLSYAEAPAEVLDDADAMQLWARKAVTAAVNQHRSSR